MRIANSDIILPASQQSVDKAEIKEGVRNWSGPRPDVQNAGTPPEVAPAVQAQDSNVVNERGPRAEAAGDRVEIDPRLSALQDLVGKIIGRPVQLLSLEDLSDYPSAPAPEVVQQEAADQQAQTEQSQALGEAVQAESRTLDFAATGLVKTADGREVQFAVSLKMDREMSSGNFEAPSLADAAQPENALVVNFNGTDAQLVDAKFSFGLDGDAGSLLALRPGTGVLVFDRNGNAKIDGAAEQPGSNTETGKTEDLKSAAPESENAGGADSREAGYNCLGRADTKPGSARANYFA